MAPADYDLLPLKKKKQVPEDQAKEQPSRNNNTNELRDEPTPNGQRRRVFFPSNAFMAFARSLHTFNRSKKMNCKLSCKAV